ncbi:MAG: hypothetical protein P1U85_11505 [Verrucomicrobiales bacterium]|nr:hypothetical protein [Verrucomicrobiales bacterium]
MTSPNSFPSLLFSGVLALFCIAFPASVSAQQEEAKEELDPYEWVIETYSFPAYELIGGFASEERGALKPPALPDSDASEEEIQDFIKKSNSVVSHYLEMQGLSFPKGSLILFDPESLTLTARLPRIAQSSVAFTSDAYLSNIEMIVELQPIIIEAPADTLREKLEKISGVSDHSEILTELEGLVAQGDATLINQTRMQTRSGQRAKIEQVRETAVPVDLALNDEAVVEYEAEFMQEGTVWETDPVIGADDETLDLNIGLKHNYAPNQRVQKLLTTDKNMTYSIAQTETYLAGLTSQYTMLSGTARLLAVWKPEIPGADQPDNLQAAFVRNELVRVLPLTTPILAGYLEEHGEKVLPTPEGAPEFEQVAEEIPEGMIVRRYTIPPTFMSTMGSSGGGAAADPFADPVASEPRFMIRATAKDILQSAGISFPEGSSANYIRQSSTLVIRNTPEQIQLVEAYIMSLRGGVEKAVAITMHIVEGPGDLIREAEANTRGVIDHKAEWARIQEIEDFSIVTTNWIEARSGQRAKVEANQSFSFPASAYAFAKASKTEKKEGEKNENDAKVTSNLAGDYETILIGTTFEVDPVLGADERTIDLNLSVEHHYAPPTTAGTAVRGENQLGLEGPTTTFHKATVTTQITTLSGMIRMLGIWEPKGTEKFDNGDILQAVFLKAEIVSLNREGEEE